MVEKSTKINNLRCSINSK